MAFTECNNIRDILYKTDVITSIINLIVHSRVSRLIELTNINIDFSLSHFYLFIYLLLLLLLKKFFWGEGRHKITH